MIKKIAKNISKIGASLYSMNYLTSKSEHYVLLPFYHAVTDESLIHIKNLYQPRGVEEFKKDLDFLLENFQSVSLNKLIEINKSGKKVKENCFHLTFDDGLKEFYTTVAPILKERGVHATIFLNSDFLDNKALFYRFKASILFDELQDDEILKMKYSEESVLDEEAVKHGIDFKKYLEVEQPYLTSEQIKELIEEGFTFGAHSKNHPLYKDIDLLEQISQTKESLATIQMQFNLDYRVFSFPFTDDGVSQQLFNEIESFTDLTFGCAGIKEDSAKNHLQRIPMETSECAKDIIKAEYLYCLAKQKIGKNKILRT